MHAVCGVEFSFSDCFFVRLVFLALVRFEVLLLVCCYMMCGKLVEEKHLGVQTESVGGVCVDS